MAKKIDTRDSLRVVTTNNFIVAKDLNELSLNARKLLYLAAAQIQQNDDHFYTFETSPRELASLWGVDSSNIYQEADKITSELMRIVITIQDGTRGFKKRHLFETCDYSEAVLTFQLHQEMTDLLLGVKKDFTKPLLMDFMRMKRSFKPMSTAPMVFELTIDELRKATGTQEKLRSVGHFKERVLDKALREIRENCLVAITYRNIKSGRSVTGFEFTAEPIYGLCDLEKMSLRERQYLRKATLSRRKMDGEKLSSSELEELENLKFILEHSGEN